MGVKKTNKYQMTFGGSSTGTMTGTSTITSNSQNVENFDNVGLEISWTGTPTGTITINGSISAAFIQPGNTNAGTFYPLTFSPGLTQPSGSAGGYLVDLNQVPFPVINVSYTNSSGTGTLNVYIVSKDLN